MYKVVKGMSFKRLAWLLAGVLLLANLGFVEIALGQQLQGWKTNTEKRSIELDELMSGGPPKDGIPAIHHRDFVCVYCWE